MINRKFGSGFEGCRHDFLLGAGDSKITCMFLPGSHGILDLSQNERETQVTHQDRRTEFLPVGPYFNFPAHALGFFFGARRRVSVRRASSSLRPRTSSVPTVERSCSSPSTANTCTSLPNEVPADPFSIRWSVERLMPARSATCSALSFRRNRASLRCSPKSARRRSYLGNSLLVSRPIKSDTLDKNARFCTACQTLCIPSSSVA